MDSAFLSIFPQYMVPQHCLSRAIGKLAELKRPLWLKNAIIKKFIQYYGVNMAEAEKPLPADYDNFNQFFTRHLLPGARVIDENPSTMASPADGVISELGQIYGDKLIQAKGRRYRLVDLLGGNKDHAALFENGQFATIYLAPKDYHRVHMPIAGQLQEMLHVPGRLFSVNQRTANAVPRLFARNERVICLFETDIGKVAIILVGAMIVASIATVWAGLIARSQEKTIRTWHYDDIFLAKGAELGHFQLGSTAIILCQANKIRWQESLAAGNAVKMGQMMACW